MGIDFCNQTERLNLRQLFGTKRDMDIKPIYTYLCPVIIFICFFSIIFNAILMSISRQSKVVNKSPILLLSLNLAVTDLIASLLNGLGILFNSYLPEVHDIKMGQCSMLMFEVVRYAALVASALHLLALAFVHYRGIVNPLHYRSTIFFSQHLSRTINIISIVCWIIPLTIMVVWFSSVPCQGFQSHECDYLFLLGFTFRYMVLTLFALPLLLMSAIYIRIFIIISRHQKGHRINHERSTLSRGVISAAGPIVTAAAVNLPELITNTNVVRCAACAARALKGGAGVEDPTIFILSEETIDNTDRASDGQPIANLRLDLDNDDDDVDNQSSSDDIRQFEETDVDIRNSLWPTHHNKQVSISDEADGRFQERVGGKRGNLIITGTGRSNDDMSLAYDDIANQGGGQLDCGRSTSRDPSMKMDKNLEKNLSYNGQNKLVVMENKGLKMIKSVKTGAKRGFISMLKEMIINRSKCRTNSREKSSSTSATRATSSKDSSTNDLVSHNQTGSGLVELHNLREPKAATSKGDVERQQTEKSFELGPKCTETVDGTIVLDSSTKSVQLIDHRFQVERGAEKMVPLGRASEEVRAEVVETLVVSDVNKLDWQVPSSSKGNGRKYKVALKNQSSLGSMRDKSNGATLTKEVKLLTLPKSSTDLSGQRGGRILLGEESKFYRTKQLSLEQRATTMRCQQSNPVSPNKPSTIPWVCTCDNKSRQYNARLSRSNTIGCKGPEGKRSKQNSSTTTSSSLDPTTASNNLLMTAGLTMNSTPNINKTMVTLSTSQGPSITSTIAPKSLKHRLYRSQTITSRLHDPGAKSKYNTPNLSNTTVLTQVSTTFEPQRRHVHASAIAQTNTKALVTTLLILGTYLISYVPAIVYQALTCTDSCPYPLYDISFSRRVLLGAMTNLLLIAKSIIDPFIYSYRMNEIQLAISRYFSKRRSKTSFAQSMQTSQRNNNNRSIHNSHYQQQASTNHQHSSLKQHQQNHPRKLHHNDLNYPNWGANSSTKILKTDINYRTAIQTTTTFDRTKEMAVLPPPMTVRASKSVSRLRDGQRKLSLQDSKGCLDEDFTNTLSPESAHRGNGAEIESTRIVEEKEIKFIEIDSSLTTTTNDIEKKLTSTISSSDQKDGKHHNDKSFLQGKINGQKNDSECIDMDIIIKDPDDAIENTSLLDKKRDQAFSQDLIC